MFTGLVETVGRVVEANERDGALRFAVAATLSGAELTRGESIAVDGVCLTVVEATREGFRTDVILETLRRTTLGAAGVGARVNLERALRVGDRLGGHLVQGHVDATLAVREVRRDGGDYRLVVGLTPEVGRYVAFKGSVALQCVSLTVAGLEADAFEVALIPETLERTTLGEMRPGGRLNVEVDLLARYLERLLGTEEPTVPGMAGGARGNHD
jgi:riboflavin synthase